jgi:hypothetical protein
MKKPSVKAADALQAAYFRRSLCDERTQLLVEISKRRGDITGRTDRGGTHAIDRRGSHLCSVEAQVRYLDRLIARRGSSLRQSKRRAQLAAELRQLLAGTTRKEQWREAAHRSPIEACVIGVHDGRDCIWGTRRVTLLEPLYYLLDSRPFR